MSLSHKDALKLLSSQVDEFIIKSTNRRVYYLVHNWTSLSHKDALKLLSPQVDKFIIGSISRRVNPIEML